jgi:hypothetical protein
MAKRPAEAGLKALIGKRPFSDEHYLDDFFMMTPCKICSNDV